MANEKFSWEEDVKGRLFRIEEDLEDVGGYDWYEILALNGITKIDSYLDRVWQVDLVEQEKRINNSTEQSLG